MNKFSLKLCTLMALSLLTFSCSKDDNGGNEGSGNSGNFVIAVLPTAATNVADYLVTAESLDKGSVSIVGNGVEQDGTIRLYVTLKDKLFSLLYGRGAPGAVTAYNIVDGNLNKLTNFQSESVHIYIPFNNDLLLVKNAAAANTNGNYLAEYYIVDSDKLLISKSGSINATAAGDGNGEYAKYNGMLKVGDKVYASYQTSYAASYYTKFPDQAWIGVYSYPEMTLDKVIHDDRTSSIGRYTANGMGLTENGDLYAFSSSTGYDKANDDPTNYDVVRTSTKPSAVLKIKSGSTEFDKDYFLNVETALSGYYITDWQYAGNNKFIAFVHPTASRGQWIRGTELAVVDVVNKTIKKVTGLPSGISSISTYNYSDNNGTIYYGVNTSTGSYVYKVDSSTATATQGLKVEGGTISAINYLQ